MSEVLDKDTIKALSTDTRQEIIKLLTKRPYTASELSKLLGKHITTVSEHLEILEKSGLIKRKDSNNKWVYYALADKGEKIFKPTYYSWIIVLSISSIIIFAGIFQMFYAQETTSYSESARIGANEVIVNDETIGATPGVSTAVPIVDETGSNLGFLVLNENRNVIDTTFSNVRKGSHVEIESGNVLVDNKEFGITSGIATAIPVITKTGELGTIITNEKGNVINSTLSYIEEGSTVKIGEENLIILGKK